MTISGHDYIIAMEIFYEVTFMDSCDSAGRKNKTDGFSECFGTGQMSVGV